MKLWESDNYQGNLNGIDGATIVSDVSDENPDLAKPPRRIFTVNFFGGERGGGGGGVPG